MLSPAVLSSSSSSSTDDSISAISSSSCLRFYSSSPFFPSSLFLLLLPVFSPLCPPPFSPLQPCGEIKDYRQTSHYFCWWRPYITETAPESERHRQRMWESGGERERERWVDWAEQRWGGTSASSSCFSVFSSSSAFVSKAFLCEIHSPTWILCLKKLKLETKLRSSD